MKEEMTSKAYMAFLEDRATAVQMDEEGFIDFELNGNTYTMSAECDSGGPEYISISCEIMEVVEEGVALAMCAANVVNAEIACAKVFMTEESVVTVSVETILAAPGGLPAVFEPMMDALDSAAEAFLTTFDEYNSESAGGE